jgi:hypothetical protein
MQTLIYTFHLTWLFYAKTCTRLFIYVLEWKDDSADLPF